MSKSHITNNGMGPAGCLELFFLSRFIFLQHTGLKKLVDQLLHGVECGKESLRRHDDTDIGLRFGRFPFLFRLQSYKIVANHPRCEMNLPDSICKDFL